MLKSSCTIILVLLLFITPCCSFWTVKVHSDYKNHIVALAGLEMLNSGGFMNALHQKIRGKSKTDNEELVQNVTQVIFNGQSEKNFETFRVKGLWKPQLAAPTANLTSVKWDNSTLIYHASNIHLNASGQLIVSGHNTTSVLFSLDAELVVAAYCVKLGEKGLYKKIAGTSTAELNNVKTNFSEPMDSIGFYNWHAWDISLSDYETVVVSQVQYAISEYIDASWKRLLIKQTNPTAHREKWTMSPLGEMLRTMFFRLSRGFWTRFWSAVAVLALLLVSSFQLYTVDNYVIYNGVGEIQKLRHTYDAGDHAVLSALSREIRLLRLFPEKNNGSYHHKFHSFSIFQEDAATVLKALETAITTVTAVNSDKDSCSLRWSPSKGDFKTENISHLVEHMVLCCSSNIFVHVSVLILRGHYYYIGPFQPGELDCNTLSNYSTGDDLSATAPYPRAIDSTFLQNISQRKPSFDNQLTVYELENTSGLQFHLPKSRFIECDQQLVVAFRRIYPKIAQLKGSIEVARTLQYVREVVVTEGVPLVLYGGALLGWYRQCDHITYSRDLDFYVESELLTQTVFESLWRNRNLKAYRRYGSPTTGLELVLFSETGSKVDIFTMQTNRTGNYSYTFMYPQTTQDIVLYPSVNTTDICTAELLNTLVYVPCNPLSFIEAEYRNGWFEPREFKVSENTKTVRTFTSTEWDLVNFVYQTSPRNCSHPSILWGCCPLPELLPQGPSKNDVSFWDPLNVTTSYFYVDRSPWSCSTIPKYLPPIIDW